MSLTALRVWRVFLVLTERAHARRTFESSEKRRTRTPILDLRTTAFMPGVDTFSKLG